MVFFDLIFEKWPSSLFFRQHFLQNYRQALPSKLESEQHDTPHLCIKINLSQPRLFILQTIYSVFFELKYCIQTTTKQIIRLASNLSVSQKSLRLCRFKQNSKKLRISIKRVLSTSLRLITKLSIFLFTSLRH